MASDNTKQSLTSNGKHLLTLDERLSIFETCSVSEKKLPFSEIYELIKYWPNFLLKDIVAVVDHVDKVDPIYFNDWQHVKSYLISNLQEKRIAPISSNESKYVLDFQADLLADICSWWLRKEKAVSKSDNIIEYHQGLLGAETDSESHLAIYDSDLHHLNNLKKEFEESAVQIQEHLTHQTTEQKNTESKFLIKYIIGGLKDHLTNEISNSNHYWAYRIFLSLIKLIYSLHPEYSYCHSAQKTQELLPNLEDFRSPEFEHSPYSWWGSPRTIFQKLTQKVVEIIQERAKLLYSENANISYPDLKEDYLIDEYWRKYKQDYRREREKTLSEDKRNNFTFKLAEVPPVEIFRDFVSGDTFYNSRSYKPRKKRVPTRNIP